MEKNRNEVPIRHLANKRLFDLVVSFLGIIILSLPMLLIALLIKCSSKGPAIFKDLRVGRGCKLFHCYKFRTMYFNAKELFAKTMHNPKYAKEYAQYRKLKNDPRVTFIGKFLRKTSLDELPQLFNILLGHMSIVGPRPYLIDEFFEFSQDFVQKIYQLRPGLTCIWQISGRSEIKFEQRQQLDVEYVNKQSFWLDLILIFKTIPKVFFSKGAY
jgi:undecaprenyl-phosphate galactose phosphotransferase